MVTGGSKEIGRLFLGRRRFPQYPCNWVGTCGFCDSGVLQSKCWSSRSGDVLWRYLSVENLNLRRNSQLSVYIDFLESIQNYEYPQGSCQRPSSRRCSPLEHSTCTSQRHICSMERGSCCWTVSGRYLDMNFQYPDLRHPYLNSRGVEYRQGPAESWRRRQRELRDSISAKECQQSILGFRECWRRGCISGRGRVPRDWSANRRVRRSVETDSCCSCWSVWGGYIGSRWFEAS